MQEAENEEIEVMREVTGTEVRDIIWVKGRTNGQSFTTPRKDKKQGEGRREVSPSPLGRKGIKPPGLSLPSVSEYEDEGLDDAFGSMWDSDARNLEDPPERVTS